MEAISESSRPQVRTVGKLILKENLPPIVIRMKGHSQGIMP